MKSIKVKLCIALWMTVILIQGIYLLTFYKQDRAYILAHENEIDFITNRLKQLDERAENIEYTQQELDRLTSQNKALISLVPTFTSGSKEVIELLRYMYANDFTQIEFKRINEKEELQLERGFISSRSYELSFIGRYESIRNLVDQFNRSYQVLHLQSLELSNKVQTLDGESNHPLLKHFGEDLYKTVSATLYLTLYTRQSEANDEEIYQPNFDLRVNPEGAFALNQDEEVDLFTLNVGERLAAGNHYILEGPGEKNEDYIELVTDTDVRIQVTLREKEYEIVMEDINGKKDQIIVQKVLTHPRMNILSLVGASSEARPDISIFIDNRTNQMMEISLEGQATENIKVFNEAGYLLSKGETKGLMQLI